MAGGKRWPPGTKRVCLFAAGLFALCLWGCSCPPGVHDETRGYFLPYPLGSTFLMVQGNNGIGDICPACSHYRQYALDFAMEQGSPVVAARAGTVDSVRDTCPDVNCPWSGGETPDCCGNFVKILHEDGTSGRYWHLMPQGVLVEPGTQVAQGDLLGLSGNTGISMLPHLHFSVRADAASTACAEMGCEAGRGCGAFGCSEDGSTEVAFADVCDDGVPQLGWTYTSRNGGPRGSP